MRENHQGDTHVTDKKIAISGEGTVTTYSWMYKASRIALQKAEASEEGEFFNAMYSLVFSAFMVEAYFNHLGAERFTDWAKIERRLSKRAKLQKLAVEVQLSRDLSTRPYTSVLEGFDFRDLLAHGRTETVEKSFEAEFDHFTSDQIMIANEWMEFCTVENARRIFDDCTIVIGQLHDAAGLGKYPFESFHISVYSAHEPGPTENA
jgi:hypothetical protein